ncbi:hypothetical protein [Nocardioides deserti]|uniref:DUF2867 domain-containing protein n=1 Tax=Nocardioides deserti TaxID=1588644 RepID=A0ABR6U5H0_9ACTN|nr:hypothetical protein [Nocardioides deserti]MBC2959645.1 hypothetical protein [Nocardioides deserti]GGO74145.1 hypothetical protein GCM10012276_21470 [Nocardioides deserti]
MPEPTGRPFSTGEEAVARVAADPFWSVVRRRHPDLGVVVLPPTAAARPTEDEVAALPEVDPSEETARVESLAVDLWTVLVGDEPGEVATRRTAGRARGTVRVETTVRLAGIDPTGGVAVVSRAEDTLVRDGWHVLAPPDGMPRVLAGRGEGVAREELQLVLAPVEGHLVLRHRAGDVRLVEDTGGTDGTGVEGAPA